MVYLRACSITRALSSVLSLGKLDVRSRELTCSVGDGDGFRLYHTPGPFWRGPLKLRKVPTAPKGELTRRVPITDHADLKNETLSVRIAGVDAPELAHFGNPAQPHGKESLEWLTKTVLGKRLRVQVLRRDQYGRIVSAFTKAQLRRVEGS